MNWPDHIWALECQGRQTQLTKLNKKL